MATVLALSMPIAGTAASAQTRTLARETRTPGVSQSGASGNDTSYNGLALTPPMGYNDWFQFGCGINEATMVAQANALVSTGLAAKGYKYVNIDDCWQAPARDANANLVADPVKFPHGIKWLADYVHSLGLKLGIYTSAGTATCDHFPGSYGHYEQDAQTFASWGVDYVKFDYCFGVPQNVPLQQLETEMSNALRATGRPIVFSYESGPQSWSASVANLWRIGPDLLGFPTAISTFQTDLGYAEYAGPGHWNDLDMMPIGNTNPEYADWTVDQQQTIMSIWSEMASPLLISNDLTHMSPDAQRILGNTDVIAVDQDPLGKQGRLVAQQGPVDIVARPLAGGDVALLMVNTSASSAAVGSVSAQETGINSSDTGTYALKNLWTGQTTETADTIAASIPPYGSVMYRVSPGYPTSGPPSALVNIDSSSQVMTAGQPASVTVAYTNNGTLPAQKVSLGLQSAASGWTIQAASPSLFPAVPPGATVSTKWTVTPAAAASTGVSLTATARYDWPSSGNTAEADASAPVYVLPAGWQSLPSLASAFNSVGITDDAHPGGDLYQGNFSYSAQALAAAGFSTGATVQVSGLHFQWPDAAPGTPDNVTGGPSTGIAVNGTGNTLGMLASETGGGATVNGLVVYADGTADLYTAILPNWTGAPAPSADPDVSTAVALPYRNISAGQDNSPVYIDLITIPVNPNKQVAAVLLPDDQFFHLFSVAVGTPN